MLGATIVLGLVAAALSFLGLGVPPPTPRWGATLAFGLSFLRDSPHLATFPGLAIMLTVLSLNLLGDGLRDLTDPACAAADRRERDGVGRLTGRRETMRRTSASPCATGDAERQTS